MALKSLRETPASSPVSQRHYLPLDCRTPSRVICLHPGNDPRSDHMSRSFISILIIFIIVGATYVLSQRGARESSVKVEDIQMGPIRHSQLSDELLARITAIEGKVAEVYPQTQEQWVEGFQRDRDPEIEIAIWENIPSAYQTFTTPRNLSRPARLEAFGLLLVRSSSADMEG